MATPNVNVIFHGLCLFVQRSGAVEVLIPNMGQEHDVRAGSFLLERGLIPRPIDQPYVLRGVLPGTATFPPGDCVVKGFDYDPKLGPADLLARMLLPVPEEILPLRRATGTYITTVDPLDIVGGKAPSGVVVFRYEARDLTKVDLYPHETPLAPHKMTLAGPDFLNIHVISGPDRGQLPLTPGVFSHQTDGLQKLLNMLPALRGTIVLDVQATLAQGMSFGDDPGPVQATFPAKGFCIQETADAFELQPHLANAAMQWRTGPGQLAVIAAIGIGPLDCGWWCVDLS